VWKNRLFQVRVGIAGTLGKKLSVLQGGL